MNEEGGVDALDNKRDENSKVPSATYGSMVFVEMRLEIQSFWNWFETNREILKPSNISEVDQTTLDKKVKMLGIPGWEVGPYERADLSFFAFSPAGDSEVLKFTETLVGEAPAIDGWVFLPAKPPKRWSRKFNWPTTNQRIDASTWKFAIYRYPDGLSDVVLVGDIDGTFTREEKLRIVDFVVGSEIGELAAIKNINAIDIENDGIHDSASLLGTSELKEYLKKSPT